MLRARCSPVDPRGPAARPVARPAFAADVTTGNVICYDAGVCRGDMVRFSLIPRQEQFFSEFVGMSQQIALGAVTLQQMLASDPPDMAKAQTIKEIRARL